MMVTDFLIPLRYEWLSYSKMSFGVGLGLPQVGGVKGQFLTRLGAAGEFERALIRQDV